jgi:hypothetical protein
MNKDLETEKLALEVFSILEDHLSELRRVNRHNPDSHCLYLACTVIQHQPPAYKDLLAAEEELIKSQVWGLDQAPLLSVVRKAKELVDSGMVETEGLQSISKILEDWSIYHSALNTLRSAVFFSEPAHKSVLSRAIKELDNCKPYATPWEVGEIERAIVKLEQYLEALKVLEKMSRQTINPLGYTVEEVKPGVISRTILIPVDSDAELWKMCQARGAVGPMPSTQAMVNYLLEKAGPNSWEC